jgi:predicted permease
MWADIRFALRLHRRNVRPVLAVTVGLALAVGLATAMVTIVRALTDTTVGLADARRFYFAGAARVGDEPSRPVTTADLPLLTDALGSDVVTGILPSGARSIDDRELQRPAPVHFVGANFFRMTDAAFERGMGFHTDPAPGAIPPLVVSRAAWRHYFDSSAVIVGTAVQLNGRTFVVVGVAARGFAGPYTTAPAFWAPLSSYDPDWRDGGRLRASATQWMTALVRLPEDATVAWAVSRLSPVFTLPVLRPVADGGGFREAVPVAVTVGTLCVLLLLLGCANVGTLVAATNAERHAELRTRAALGASRGRLIRQLLTEGVVLGGLAAAGGVWVASFLGPVFLSLGAFPALDFHLDGVTLAGAIGAAVLSSVVSSIWPAWRASARVAQSRRPSRRVLLAIQAAACIAVLAVAGLLERGAARAQVVDVGFDDERVWTINALVGLTRSPEEGAIRIDHATRLLGAHPAVEAVAVGSRTAFGGSSSRFGASVGGDDVGVYVKRVSSGWFATLGIPLLTGRDFASVADDADNVVIVSDGLARRAWGGEDPIGTDAGRLNASLSGATVIGVAADALPHSLLDTGTGAHTVYRPLQLADLNGAQLFVRTARPPSEAFEIIRGVMAAGFPDQRYRPVQMSEVVDSYRTGLQVPARAISLVSVAMLALALIGIAGVTATFVRLRQQDLAIHLVLGADPAGLRRLVTRQYLWPVSVGIGAGAAMAALAGFGMRAMLVGVHPVDPLALGTASALLLAGAWLASLAASRKAMVVATADVLRDR